MALPTTEALHLTCLPSLFLSKADPALYLSFHLSKPRDACGDKWIRFV